MWLADFRPRAMRDDPDRFVIAPHHPDRLRRPAASPGAVLDDRFHQALVWNTFRTLELVAPSFWLRRFHLRLTGEPSLVSPQSGTQRPRMAVGRRDRSGPRRPHNR